ncbi:outer membrane lipid asymmetry maintenance protein MlaD [Laribacter hongkongensis]|jgi:phospholipid/cholesterol/gamma-HCH transport system substrate-binding protein|uniref:Outer membrane lipid asymmetry maintenance protein MlaD n=2 Tax=Laribacter hongkongensis TaxID=168471 RepID=A0AAP2SS86_9NEIS|nr:outer membrane lipid asymmetry maintenance protein MlaD [Laribacter hongkongensis]ACO74053.1 probable ABC transport system substrate-binding protein [Laribacter hongkongensis HLHK9]MBE5529396.1 outer membrane lipid asymmetry maintenance protein MlaD [Laribacter hongkongensis]MCG8991029.1 outer membrane lipid asymmetry maintenance protein MlaD [Laribacter hongkongensis]MCG8994771.1 outer membrane lipid asymmetry maintenance protein MlaD [Laribacter hongkongensis]MCG8996902.1 outer membrane l
MKRATIDLWVGIFALIGFGAILFLALKVANLTTTSTGTTYTVVADFDNIGGLKVRAPVKAAGVIVGRVTDIRLDTHTMRARVALALDSQYQFARDVAASINTSGLLGEQYVALLDGGDTEMLKAGDRIQITSSAMVLEDLIGKFMTSFAEQGAGEPAGKP